jgi:hypothetical protein
MGRENADFKSLLVECFSTKLYNKGFFEKFSIGNKNPKIIFGHINPFYRQVYLKILL